MGGQQPALRQTSGGPAAPAGGISGAPRPPGSGAGGARAGAGDEQRHDRSAAGNDPQGPSGSNDWRRPPRAYSGVRRRVPVRTFKGWDNHHEPGWLEIDLVAHCGGRMQGPFLWTLVATDIATGWSESVPILVRDGAVVLTALQLIRRQLTFPLRGIDADNDPVFVNRLMEGWCDRAGHQIVLTRSGHPGEPPPHGLAHQLPRLRRSAGPPPPPGPCPYGATPAAAA
jgi:hypothetical protein